MYACRAGRRSANAIDYAKFRSRSHDAVIRVYDDAGNVIETHEHAGGSKDGDFALEIPPEFALKQVSVTPLLSGSSPATKGIRRNNSVKYYGEIPSTPRSAVMVPPVIEEGR
jgi:hypothetical protein